MARSSRPSAYLPTTSLVLQGCLLLVLLLSLAGAFFLAWLANYGARMTVRNSSGSRVDDLQVTLQVFYHVARPKGSGPPYSETHTTPTLTAGDAFAVRHGLSDFSTKLRFSLAGRAYEYEEEYIDLWTGEGWVFEIQENGAVSSSYDYPNFELHPLEPFTK